MGQPVYKFLEDFGGGDAPNAAVQWAPRVVGQPAQEPPAPPKDTAYEKGLEDGMAASRTMLEVEIARIRGEAERNLEAAKADFSRAVASELSEGLQQHLEDLRASLADQLAMALSPILRHVLTEAAIRDLANEMRELIDGKQAVSVELHGPRDLIDGVMEKYTAITDAESSPHAPEVRLAYADASEIRLNVDNTLVETRMMEWIGKLSEATN